MASEREKEKLIAYLIGILESKHAHGKPVPVDRINERLEEVGLSRMEIEDNPETLAGLR